MTIVLAFLAIVIGIAAWWLSTQRIMSKPWLEIGVIDEPPGVRPPTAKIGLGVFLAVAGVLFALSISAYSMRLQAADWWPLPVPRLLWFNTGLLILASAALEWTKTQSRHADLNGVRFGLIGAGVLTLAFVIGQLVVWRELVGEGYFLASNPANAFFYLMTGLHGLHVLGGLVALARVTLRAFSADEDPRRAGQAAARPRAVRHLLAFPARRVAGPVCADRRLGRRFLRDLSSGVELKMS